MTDGIENCQPKTGVSFEKSQPKPVRCGCGGATRRCADPITGQWFVQCRACGTVALYYNTEAEAIEAWNRAMGERTAKVIEHDASVTVTDGYKYHRSEYLCGACKKKVIGGDDYCSHCGARLEWV